MTQGLWAKSFRPKAISDRGIWNRPLWISLGINSEAAWAVAKNSFIYSFWDGHFDITFVFRDMLSDIWKRFKAPNTYICIRVSFDINCLGSLALDNSKFISDRCHNNCVKLKSEPGWSSDTEYLLCVLFGYFLCLQVARAFVIGETVARICLEKGFFSNQSYNIHNKLWQCNWMFGDWLGPESGPLFTDRLMLRVGFKGE